MLTPVMQNGLVFGGWMCVMFTTFLAVVGFVNPEIMLGDYPPDVRAKYGPQSERAKRQGAVIMPLFFVALIALFTASVLSLKQAVGTLTFADVFLSALVTMLTFNVYDLLVLDWLMFVKWQPKFAVLPGTEGMAGYSDLMFHFRGFLIGLVWSVGLALVVAGVTAIII